jgi:hypothetical protein
MMKFVSIEPNLWAKAQSFLGNADISVYSFPPEVDLDFTPLKRRYFELSVRIYSQQNERYWVPVCLVN